MGLRAKALQTRGALIAATGGGQIIALCLSVYLGKIYNPELIGQFAAILSVFPAFCILVGLRYEQAITFATGAREVRALIRITLVAAGTIGMAAACLAVLYYFAFKPVIDGLAYSYCVLVLVISSCAAIYNRIAVLLLTRVGQSIAVLGFLRSVPVPLSQVLLGMSGFGLAGLIGGHLIGWVLIAITSCVALRGLHGYFRVSPGTSIYSVALRNRKFPIYNLPQNLVFTLADALVPLALADRFGVLEAGLYWFAMRVALAPAQLLIESCRPLVYRFVARLTDAGARAVLRQAVIVSVPMVLATVFAMFFGEYLIERMLGQVWLGAYQYACFTMAAYCVHAFMLPFIALLNRRGDQAVHLVAEVFAGVIRVGGIYLPLSHGAQAYGVALLASLIPYLCLIFFLVMPTRGAKA